MAGTRIAEAFVAVSADMAGLSAGMRQGQAITTSAVNSMQRSLGGMQSMLGMIGVGVGFGAIIGGIRGTIAEAQVAMDSQTRLAAAVETSGKAAGFSAEQMATFATELQGVTTAGDETIKDAMTTLTTFPKVAGEMFKRATKAALDMQEKGFGGMGGNARMLGRALEDPRRGLMMLTRMGVTFSEQQRKQIKDLMEQNKLGEAQQVIMGAVEGKFKGVAEAMAKTPSGRIKQLTEATGDLREEIGTKLMPLMVRWKETQFAITKAVLNFVDVVEPMIGGLADQWIKLNDAAGGWLNNGAMTVASIAAIGLAFTGLKWAVTTLILPIVIATSKMVIMTGVMIGKAVVAITLMTAKAIIAASVFLVELPVAIAAASASMVAFSTQTVAATTAALATFGAQLALLWPVVIAFGAALALSVGAAEIALVAFSASGAWTELDRRTKNFKAVWTDAWDKAASSTTTAFRSIKAAIQVGDIAGVMEVMWAQIQVYWVVGINAIKSTWIEFQNWLTSNVVTIGEMFTSAILAPIRYIQDGILKVLNMIQKMPGGEMMFKVATKMDLKNVKQTAEGLLPSEAAVKDRFAEIQNAVDSDRKALLKKNADEEAKALDELEDRKAEIHNAAQRKEVAERMKRLAEEKAGEGKGAGDEEKGGGVTAGGVSPFLGITELNRKMQEALLKDTLGKDQLDVAKEQLDVQKEMRDNLAGEEPDRQPGVMPEPAPAAAPANAPAVAPNQLSQFEQQKAAKKSAFEQQQEDKQAKFLKGRKPKGQAAAEKPAAPEMGFFLPGDKNPKRDAAIKERAEREAAGAANGWERELDKNIAKERIRQNQEARNQKHENAEARAELRRVQMEEKRTPEQEARKPVIDTRLELGRAVRAAAEPEGEPGLFMGEGVKNTDIKKPASSDLIDLSKKAVMAELQYFLHKVMSGEAKEKPAAETTKNDKVTASIEQSQMEKFGNTVGDKIASRLKPTYVAIV